MLGKRLFTLILLLLSTGTLVLRAQDYPVTVPDGPALTVKADSLSISQQPYLLMDYSPPPVIQLPSILTPPLFETKEERASRINARTEADVIRSLQQNLQWYQPPRFSRTDKMLLRFAGLFLTSPYRLPEGCVPLMNASNPFFFVRTPGLAPYEHLYSPTFFPQCIRTDYDFASGTYKQVVVPWSTVNTNLTRSFGGPYQNAPVPKMYFTSTERALQQ